MRQIGDLVIGVVLVLILAAAVYFTPRFSEYGSISRRIILGGQLFPKFLRSHVEELPEG